MSIRSGQGDCDAHGGAGGVIRVYEDDPGDAKMNKPAQVLKFIELKSGYNDNGPAWIARVKLSKSGRTIYFDGRALKQGGRGAPGNFFDRATSLLPIIMWLNIPFSPSHTQTPGRCAPMGRCSAPGGAS